MTSLQLTGYLLWGISLAAILRSLSFSEFKTNRLRQHLVFGSAAALFVLWLFRAGIFDGLDVHFLWLSAVTLTLGFRYAILAASLTLTGITVAGFESWQMLGVNAVTGILVPVAVTYVIYSVTFHRIPRNLFIYIFLCAFFPAAMSIALKTALLGGYYLTDDIYNWTTVSDNYLLLIPLLLFPEALLNGMTMTLLVIYKPEWVYTFHDKFYIDGK
ncbi:energy-coupling factor ABC transporter permease [Alteromonas sp. CYL-A6]|uniref:energy-coupling factor ABC transporter permease n=1 Tax=Alteromonas nitratireducens TaxID=3390813 RepID=UPI0034C1FB01